MMIMMPWTKWAYNRQQIKEHSSGIGYTRNTNIQKPEVLKVPGPPKTNSAESCLIL